MVLLQKFCELGWPLIIPYKFSIFCPHLHLLWQICCSAHLLAFGKVSRPRWTLAGKLHLICVDSNQNWHFQKITIPDICHIFYTSRLLGLKISHSKLRKFATNLFSRQNSVNHHNRANLHTVGKITHAIYKITHYVWNYTLRAKLHCPDSFSHSL